MNAHFTVFRPTGPSWRQHARHLLAALFALALTACGTVKPPDAPPLNPVPVAVPAPAPTPVLPGPGPGKLRPKAPLATRQAKAPAQAPTVVDAVPKVERIASGAPNRPYEIKGETYVPANTDLPWTESGVASWYGAPFHGRRTATGEVYNMHTMTAAHKTMPLPSYAVVTNRRNGRSVVVRINDRGPFISGRVIDLSLAAARKLGISGLGQVDVRRLTNADILAQSWRSPPQAVASSR